MKILFHFLLLVGVATVVQAASIKTQVFVKRTGGDQVAPNNEFITTITHSGGGHITLPSFVPSNTEFPGALGQPIAEHTFSERGVPGAIRVRVIEDDGPKKRDDGVCNLKLTTKFTSTPIIVECKREANDGLGDINIINVRVQVV